MLGCTTQPWSPKHSECKRPQGMSHLGHRWTRSLSSQDLFFCQLGATEGPGICYFIKTRRGGCELEGHKPACSQSVRPGWAPGQGCRQSCWPAHPPALARVSIDACQQPSDLRLWTSLSPPGTCLKLNTPQTSPSPAKAPAPSW